MPYVNPLDPATPAAGAFLSEGDDRIRELKLAIRERLLTVFADVDVNPLAFIAGIIATAALANNAVSTTKIADNAVTTLKLIDAAVTNAKVAGGLDGSKIADATIDTLQLKDASVTAAKLAAGAAVPDGSITDIKIANDTIEVEKLSNAAKALIAITKTVTVTVITGSQGSDSNTEVASAALVGAAFNDAVEVGIPDADGWTAAELTNTWFAYVDAVGHVKMRVQNNTGGAKAWPGGDFKLRITKSATDWGL